ncbi:universal stress protein [Halostagnicola sp. A-GB9-2]|uniref:universal stress protein n=1 Tax=Halostagnicola sp. A-GB9-2 TaxID=3048066 RepID=UPI0024BFFEB9|nr:universal stress protein [Halostagnicola sp. A-GB9-2]MDJ1433844.1 universal stress protein [Halostagnicola sp. A-GB9-2]
MTVLAAVGEEHSSAQTVSIGYDLAVKYDEELVVLHVIPEKDFEEHKAEIERKSHGFQDFSLSQEEESASRFSQRVVEEVLGEYEYERVKMAGRVGDPATAILTEAESIDPRYLVIGGRQRTPIGKAVFGSVTQDILLQSEWPVVTTMRE